MIDSLKMKKLETFPPEMLIHQHEIEEILDLVQLIENPQEYIRDQIIPQMDQRGSRSQPLTGSEVLHKLFNLPPEKPGEIFETISGELHDKGFQLTPELASEIADIIYYTSQPNCPNHTQDPSSFLDFLDIDTKLANKFCTIKYKIRLQFGDQKNHKTIENSALKLFLQTINN